MSAQTNSIQDLFSINNKVALITGGSRGIGLMIAKAYVDNGAKVYITARSQEQCEQTAATLSEIGSCTAIVADVATDEGIQRIYDVLQAREQTLDILVNNAGIGMDPNRKDGFEGFPTEAYDKVMAVNARAPFMLVRKLIRLLEKGATTADPARIINIGSSSGIKVQAAKGAGAGSYGPSKAMLHYMTQEWGVHFAHRHITANAIAAGAFPTDILPEEVHQMAADTVPLKRIGNASDMAGTAIYLASRASAFMTGEIIKVDGGYTL